MKCSHCAAPLSLRSRNCPKCGAPNDITVRHRQELDAKLGEIVRKWIVADVQSRCVPKEWDGLSPYDQLTRVVDRIAEIRRELRGKIDEAKPRPRTPFDFYDPPSVAQHVFDQIREVVSRFVEQTRIDYLLSEIERALRDERYDLEHERVMSRTE